MQANNKITKTDLIEIIAEELNTSKINAEKFLNTTLESIVNLVSQGKTVRLTGFGSFQKSERKAREGVNPKTKTRIVISSYATASFKVGKNFKEIVRDSGTMGLTSN